MVFYLPYVYVGFQSVHLEGKKDQQGQVAIEFTRKHYGGFWQIHERLENVQNATLKTSLIHRSSPRRLRLTSGVFLETETEAVRLLAGSSNVNDNLKGDAVESINSFMKSPEKDYFDTTIRLTNIFGWVGLPFLLLRAMGLLGWPVSIYQYLKNK